MVAGVDVEDRARDVARVVGEQEGAGGRDIGGIQTPWVAGDYVFVITLQNQLMCLTRKEGRVKWIHQLPRWTDPADTTSDPIVWSGPVLVSDRLIVVSSDGFAQAVDLVDKQNIAFFQIRQNRRRPRRL